MSRRNVGAGERQWLTALRKPLAVALVAGALGTLAACGGGGGSKAAVTTAAPPASSAATSSAGAQAKAASTTTSTTAASPAITASTTAKSGKVNANSASQTDLASAFQAAGVPSADRWAKEVDEYKPYPNDPSWAKLRQELGKYNIAPDTLAKILSVLEV